MCIFRSLPNESLGVSPYEMLYGRKCRTPLKAFKDSLRDATFSEHQNVPQFLQNLQHILERVHRFAHDNLLKAQVRMKTHYDQTSKVRKFKPGDFVLAYFPIPGSPLQNKFSGPYCVKECRNNNTYVIETPDRRRKTQLCHVNLLKQYNGTPPTVLTNYSTFTEPYIHSETFPASPPESTDKESALSNSKILNDLPKCFQDNNRAPLPSSNSTLTSSDKPFILHVDANGTDDGGVVMQQRGEKNTPVSNYCYKERRNNWQGATLPHPEASALHSTPEKCSVHHQYGPHHPIPPAARPLLISTSSTMGLLTAEIQPGDTLYQESDNILAHDLSRVYEVEATPSNTPPHNDVLLPEPQASGESCDDNLLQEIEPALPFIITSSQLYNTTMEEMSNNDNNTSKACQGEQNVCSQPPVRTQITKLPVDRYDSADWSPVWLHLPRPPQYYLMSGVAPTSVCRMFSAFVASTPPS
ncbi:uncharacterized protein [Procambarus clarkii]|uniref:uncharacterized protein n=1 Tax=Procambarus clarkii TaxID=6728 RepID=UPI00374373BC